MDLWDMMDDVERSEYMRYMAELEEEENGVQSEEPSQEETAGED